jgi:hypothetical protein
MHMQRAVSGFLVAFILALLPHAVAQAVAQDNEANRPRAGEMRFRVVHAHLANNCAGYFYVSQQSVRYTAVVPENYASHSFEIPRADVTAVQQWVLMGKTQNVVEIKTAHATYHFWVLPKDADLTMARTGNLNTTAAPAEKLITDIRDPQSALERAVAQRRASEAGAGSATAGANPNAGAVAAASAMRETSSQQGQPPAGQGSSGDSDTQGAHKLPAGALEGVYVGFSLDYSHQGSREYYFTADGWVINNIPQVNMDNFDMNAYRNDPSHKLFVGRYRVDGNQIHIVWANTGTRRDVIKFDETAASPGIDTYVPTCRCTGKRFSGKYHWASPTDQRYVQFLPDGTFFDHGLTDQIVGVPNPHGYAGITDPPRNFRGTYSVRNQKLTFSFADGKQATVAFIAPKAMEKAPKFEWMGVGHDSGVQGAETVIVLMLYEENYQLQP